MGKNDTRLEPFSGGGRSDGCSDSSAAPEPERMLRLDTFLRSELNIDDLLLRSSGEGENERSRSRGSCIAEVEVDAIAEFVVSAMLRLLCDSDGPRWREKRPEELGRSDEKEPLGGKWKERPFFGGGDGWKLYEHLVERRMQYTDRFLGLRPVEPRRDLNIVRGRQIEFWGHEGLAVVVY